MNIKDFLMDNYIYIIIVIVLIIITIIGFLADKQKNGGKKNKAAEAPLPNNVNSDIAPQPITYQPTNNNQINNMNTIPNTNLMPNKNQLNTPSDPNGLSAMPNNNVINPVNLGNTIQNTPQPVEPMNAGTYSNPESMYQPLSEQKPVIAPVNPMNNINNNLNNQMASNPEPLQQPTSNIMAGVGAYNQPVVEPTKPELAIPTSMNGGPISSGINGGMAYNQQPINPQPIPNPVENTIPSPITPPQPTMPGPVGFVYGQPTQNQNNNQQM